MPYRRTGRPPGRRRKSPRKSGERPSLTDKQWSGVRYEIAHPDASLAKIASAAGVSRQAVSQWRRENPEYVRAKAWLLGQEAARLLGEEFKREKKIRADAKKRIGDPDTTLELLYWELGGKNNWSGSVVSDFDGQTYTDLKAYVEHLKNWRSDDWGRIAWVGHLANPRAKK